MKKALFILSAFSLIAVSCAKEVMKSNETERTGRTVLTVNMPDETKVNIGEAGHRALQWSEGDTLAWNGVKSDPLVLDQDNPTQGTFTWNEVLDRPGRLIYPASFWKDDTHITLPADQGTMAGTDDIAPNSFPLYGYVGEGVVEKSLSPLCAIVRLQIKNAKDEAVTLKKVTFSGNSDEKVSGEFTIDYETTGLAAAIASVDSEKSTSVSCDKTLSKSDAIFVNMVVPARTYSAGVKFKLESKDGFYMIKSKSSETILESGKVYSFPVFEYIPNGVSDGIEISSAEELVLFAENYNEEKYNKPVAFLTKDIIFDDQTNADFLATGGIGTSGGENYFNGKFYGMNHSIKNWKNHNDESTITSVPLFAYTGNGGFIQDIVLDKSCDIAFPNGNAGSLVGRHKGLLKNCTNNADVTLLMQAGTTYFGGLVGRVFGGTVENCTMNGKLKNPTGTSSTQVYAVGGITGTLENGGIVKDCRMNSFIQWYLPVEGKASGASGPQLKNGTLYLGGIVGNLIEGTVSACSANAETDDEDDIRGNAGNCAIGGIAGYVQSGGEVESCSNNRIFYVRLSSGTILNLGGIVGNNEGTLSGANVNNAEVTGNGGQPTVCVGGLAGSNTGNITSTVDGPSNTGNVLGPSQYSTVTACYLGGLVGKTTTALSGMQNNGNVSCKKPNNESGFYLAGCVGYAEKENASLSNLTNNGKVTLGSDTWAVSSGFGDMILGGIVAKAESSIQNCNNGGDVNIEYNDTPSLLEGKKAIIGGIAGQITAENVTFNGNSNSCALSIKAPTECLCVGGLYGSVEASNTLNITGSPFTGSISILKHESGSSSSVYMFAGGIIGLAKKALTIKGTSCSLTSDISIPASSSVAAELCMGGVVGAAGEDGEGNSVSGAKVTISGITVSSGNVKMTGGSGLIPKYKKAAFGGIIGGAFAGAEISNCSSSANVIFCEKGTGDISNGNPAHLGGIAGRIEGWNSIISNCTATGNVSNYLYNNNWWNTNDQVGINAVGGIIGSFGYNIDQTYTIKISNCSSSGTEYGYRGTVGGIAGYLHKATLSGNISFTGSISRGAPAGGIVGIARDCDISGCTVKTSACKGHTAGSCKGYSGGIAGYAENTAINNCKSFSTITLNDSSKDIAGGIIGYPNASCTIGATNACSYGGKVAGTTISAGNVDQYAIGNTAMTPTNVTYWNGK